MIQLQNTQQQPKRQASLFSPECPNTSVAHVSGYALHEAFITSPYVMQHTLSWTIADGMHPERYSATV